MERIAYLYTWYSLTLAMAVILLLIFVANVIYVPVLPMIGDHPIGDFVFWLMGVFLIASMSFLWRLADSLGRSGVLWVLGSIVFAPLGLLVAYAIMVVVVRSVKKRAAA